MMSGRFRKDDYVVYGKTGVCQVVKRERISFGTSDNGEYYVLAPMSDCRSLIYVPCDNADLMSRLRPLLNKLQIDEILQEVPERELCWIEDKNERASYFRSLIAEGDRRQLVRIIRCLYKRKQEKMIVGKKLSTGDEAMLQDCVRMVEEEFSISLGISRDEVGAYIHNRLNMQ